MRYACCCSFGWMLLLAVTLSGAQNSPRPPEEETPVFGTTVVSSSGLKGDIYYLHHTAKKLPNFKKMKPVGSIYTNFLNIPSMDFQKGFPSITDRFEWFAIDYTGRFWVEQPDRYLFALTSDDGSKLYIDDKLVIDNDGIHATIEEMGQKQLDRGIHTIRVSYFQGPRFHVALVLQVGRPGERLHIFHMEDFKPPADLHDWPPVSDAARGGLHHSGK